MNSIPEVIRTAIDLVRRYNLELTLDNVRANIDTGALTMDDASEALRRHINTQIPVVMKQEGLLIANIKTRARKDFWDCSTDELEEQMEIKRSGANADRKRIEVDEAVVKFLREKQETFGYEVYPGLFHAEIDRLYAMHGYPSPKEAA